MAERKKSTYATTILGCVKRIRNHDGHDSGSETADLLRQIEEIAKVQKAKEKLPDKAARLRAKAEALAAEAAKLEAVS